MDKYVLVIGNDDNLYSFDAMDEAIVKAFNLGFKYAEIVQWQPGEPEVVMLLWDVASDVNNPQNFVSPACIEIR